MNVLQTVNRLPPEILTHIASYHSCNEDSRHGDPRMPTLEGCARLIRNALDRNSNQHHVPSPDRTLVGKFEIRPPHRRHPLSRGSRHPRTSLGADKMPGYQLSDMAGAGYVLGSCLRLPNPIVQRTIPPGIHSATGLILLSVVLFTLPNLKTSPF